MKTETRKYLRYNMNPHAMSQNNCHLENLESLRRQLPSLDIGTSSRQDSLQFDCKSHRQDLESDEPSSITRLRQQSPQTKAKSKCTMLSSKMRLMVFIKIILKCLETEGFESNVRRDAKQIIANCTLKNRQGHPDYTPLEEAIERSLRLVIDDCHWNRAETLMQHYIMSCSRNQSPCKPVKSDPSCYAQV